MSREKDNDAFGDRVDHEINYTSPAETQDKYDTMPTNKTKDSSSWIPQIPSGYIRTALLRVTSPDASATEVPPQAGAQADCMACRVTGSIGCCGVGAYLLYEWRQIPKTQSGHRIALLTMSTGFFALGIYRAIM